MSKSYGNYIGINEPPQEIYGKVMSVSDDLMWRYYELLTDVKVAEIEQMKADAASGRQHPMELKKALARRIVQDFHGEQAAKQRMRTGPSSFRRMRCQRMWSNCGTLEDQESCYSALLKDSQMLPRNLNSCRNDSDKLVIVAAGNRPRDGNERSRREQEDKMAVKFNDRVRCRACNRD